MILNKDWVKSNLPLPVNKGFYGVLLVPVSKTAKAMKIESEKRYFDIAFFGCI